MRQSWLGTAHQECCQLLRPGIDSHQLCSGPASKPTEVNGKTPTASNDSSNHILCPPHSPLPSRHFLHSFRPLLLCQDHQCCPTARNAPCAQTLMVPLWKPLSLWSQFWFSRSMAWAMCLLTEQRARHRFSKHFIGCLRDAGNLIENKTEPEIKISIILNT